MTDTPSNSVEEDNLTFDQLLENHAEEKKKLPKTIIALRKSVPKNDKQKKREITLKIADLEHDLKKKHEEEIRMFKAKEAGLDPNNETKDEADDGISLDRLNRLTLNETEKSISSVPEQALEEHKPKKKINKARARIEKRNLEMERLRQEAEAEAENMVDMGAVETIEIKKLLVPMQLKIKQITADGHCLYNAFSDQLKARYGKQVDYKKLRKLAAEHMRCHQSDFEPFLYLEDGNFNRYCDDIENTACWGGQLEILALARSTEVPVDVIQYQGPVIKFCDDEYPDKKPIKLAYHKHQFSLGAHYNSLVDQLEV